MKRMIVGYLSYLTEANKNQRLNDFYVSVDSMSLFKSNQIELISIDNSSIDEAKQKLISSPRFSHHFHYKNNHYDVAMFYTTMWHATKSSADYICFLYDDFIAYDDAFDDVIKFMDENLDVSCVRIPAYNYENKQLFDSQITSKSENPDSIRHYNFVTNAELVWNGPIRVGHHNFYKNNWHYTSRPMVWRNDFFRKVLESQGDHSNILQGFESWACKAFNNANLVTGVLDKGMVKTTPVSRSARGLELPPSKEKDIKISVDLLFNEYKKIKGI